MSYIWNELYISIVMKQYNSKNETYSWRGGFVGHERIEHIPCEGVQAIKHNKVVQNIRLFVERLDSIMGFLGEQELGFRGYYEGEDSVNRGNYL